MFAAHTHTARINTRKNLVYAKRNRSINHANVVMVKVKGFPNPPIEKLLLAILQNNRISTFIEFAAIFHPTPAPFWCSETYPNILFVYSNLFSWGRIIFATLIHDSTHARLVFRICALNSGQSCLSCPMWINISRKLATWVLISINICKIICEWFMRQQICCWCRGNLCLHLANLAYRIPSLFIR